MGMQALYVVVAILIISLVMFFLGSTDYGLSFNFDRLEDRIIRVPMSDIFFEPGDHFAFDLYDEEGELHSIPLHRIREVHRDGELIWHREH